MVQGRFNLGLPFIGKMNDIGILIGKIGAGPSHGAIHSTGKPSGEMGFKTTGAEDSLGALSVVFLGEFVVNVCELLRGACDCGDAEGVDLETPSQSLGVVLLGIGGGKDGSHGFFLFLGWVLGVSGSVDELVVTAHAQVKR